MGNYILMAYTDNLPFSNAFLAEEHFGTAYKQEIYFQNVEDEIGMKNS